MINGLNSYRSFSISRYPSPRLSLPGWLPAIRADGRQYQDATMLLLRRPPTALLFAENDGRRLGPLSLSY